MTPASVPCKGCTHYLEGSRCSIHDRAPIVCRVYDCRKEYKLFTSLSPGERIARLSVHGLVNAATLKRGRELSETESEP